VPITFFPKAEALTPEFVKIVGHVERVHLQNRLLGELLTMWLKFGVALSGFLTSIDEVVRGKTQLTCPIRVTTRLKPLWEKR